MTACMSSTAETATGRSELEDGSVPPGTGLATLRRYERARAEPILAMNIAVGGLFSLFGGSSKGMARMRTAGLNLTDHIPVLKNLLIRQAMG